MTVDAFRFVIESDWSHGGFGSAGEVVPMGVELVKEEPVTAKTRAWLEVPEAVMAAARGKSFKLRIPGVRGQVVTLTLELPRSRPFAGMNPADDPESAAMLEDVGLQPLLQGPRRVLVAQRAVRDGRPSAG
jgi:hypothetical protein